MFNRRRKQRRLDAAHRTHRPRMRRLAVETMESRLLLSGNQLTGGDIDSSIWNLDSVGPNPYVVISQGDVAAPPTISASDSSPTDDAPSLYYNPPSVVLSNYLNTNSLDVGPAIGGSHNLIVAWANKTPGAMTSLFGSGGRIADDTDQGGVTRLDLNTLLELRAQARFQLVGQIGGDSVITFDSSGKTLSTGWVSTQPFVAASLQQGGPGTTANLVIAPSIESPLVDAPLVTPVAEHLAIKPSLITPVAENTAKSDFTPATPTTNTPSDSANIAASKVESLLGPGAGNTAAGNQVAVTIPAQIADAVSPVRQPMRDERLADAIDDLLSEEVIINAPAGETGMEYVADGSSGGLGTTADFGDSQSEGELFSGAVQIADGGMIPIDVLVAAAGSEVESITASAGAELAATGGSTGALGELSRVAVMELIEGEAEPGAAESSDHVMVVAQNDADPRGAFRVVAHQAGVAVALAAPTGPTYLASITAVAVDAASRAMATLVGNHLAAETTELATTDAARHAAFSELGGAADEVESTAELDGPHWNRWLAATPLAVAIACERALAIRKKRHEQRDPSRPRTAK